MVSQTEGFDHIIPAHGNKSLLGKYGKDIDRQNLLSSSMIHPLNIAKRAQEALTKVAQATLSNWDYVQIREPMGHIYHSKHHKDQTLIKFQTKMNYDFRILIYHSNCN